MIEVGKWYDTAPNCKSAEQYIKVIEFNNERIYYNEVIYYGEYRIRTTMGSIPFYNFDGKSKEVAIHEIAQYLPDGHPDLLAGRKKTNWQHTFYIALMRELLEKPVEKWSVGSYVVMLVDKAVCIEPAKKGDIAIVIKEGWIRLLKNNSSWSCNQFYENIINVKWFPTLAEAQQFSNQLTNNMKELNITIPTGYEVDWEASANQKKVVLKEINKLPMSWNELKKVDGYYVDTYSYVSDTEMQVAIESSKNIFPTEALAKASLAMAQLTQLHQAWHKVLNQSVTYRLGDDLFSIRRLGDKPCIKEESLKVCGFISFYRLEDARKFKETFQDLLIEALPLL